MAKGAYIGVDNVARKIKKGYIGVDGTARKIKKAYIGIGGVARPCWGGGELAYYGQTSSKLAAPVSYAKAASTGNYAVFHGGQGNVTSFNPTAFSSSLTVTKISNYVINVLTNNASTSFDNRAMFAGGCYDESMHVTNQVVVYDSSLARTYLSMSLPRYNLGGACNNSYALFAGGLDIYAEVAGHGTMVDAFSTSLTRSTATNLSTDTYSPVGVSFGQYALFAGGFTGMTSNGFTTVYAYDTALTQRVLTPLSTKRCQHMGAAVGNHAIFAGGVSGSYTTKVAEAYDSSLTHSLLANTAQAHREGEATAVGDYALFAGGSTTASDGYQKYVDVFDASLTGFATTNMKQGRFRHGAATIGDFALFGGGYNGGVSGGYLDTVEAYTLV